MIDPSKDLLRRAERWDLTVSDTDPPTIVAFDGGTPLDRPVVLEGLSDIETAIQAGVAILDRLHAPQPVQLDLFGGA